MTLLKREEIDKKYQWDLSKIYKNDTEIEKDIENVKQLTKELVSYQNHILDNSDCLYKCLELDTNIGRTLSKLNCYVSNYVNEDMSNNRALVLKQTLDNLLVTVMEQLAFFEPEILSQKYETVMGLVDNDNRFLPYQFYLKDLFHLKDHTLSTLEERILAKSTEAINGASDIYDKLHDLDLKFGQIKDEHGCLVELTNSNYGKYLASFNRDVRKDAFNTLYRGYMSFSNTLAECLSKNVKSAYFIANTRHYHDTLEMKLSEEEISTKLYDKLITEVSAKLDYSKKYISLRKKILGLDTMHMYDLYVPLINLGEKEYSYDQAKMIITEVLQLLGDDYLSKVNYIFDNNMIDVYSNIGKSSGAYSTGTYDTLPYILLNYENRYYDVDTLIHEMGHSVHTCYANMNQPIQTADYSIFIAEIASTVNEVLLNKYLFGKSTDKQEKLFYLNNLLDMYRTTLIRQTMFAEFEKIIHTASQSGEALTKDYICKIYYDLNKKYYGDDVVSDEEIAFEWARVEHFYNEFYVYKYATGFAIAIRIATGILNHDKQVLNDYISILKSGGSDYPLNILKKYGIDIASDDTIKQSLENFKETLELFEKTYNE